MDKILIIDDSPTQADFLKMILEDDYDLTVVHTGAEGLSHAKSGEYSLVLLDVVMPDMDGFVLLKKLQEEESTKHIPVIMITNLSDEGSEERGLRLGAVDYIRKPFHAPIVRARVNTHIKLYHYRAHIERQAMMDQLTGVPNRRRYDDSYMERWQNAARLRVPISLCMIDIDNFKAYNDTFGHPAGDKVIAAVAQTATAHLGRRTDFLARYGGEEFVIILLGNDVQSAFEHLQVIRQAVEDLNIPQKPEIAPWVTISVGGVTLTPKLSDNYDTYLKIADTMLYDAKRFGRNQVVWSNGQAEQMREKRA